MTVSAGGMDGVLQRSATEIRRENGSSGSESKPLAAFRPARAYVLLGDPGAGKTTAFRAEAKLTNGEYVTVRRFLRSSCPASKWRDKTLFLDALDEARAGEGDPRRPLDKLLERLADIGNPKMRLSCRAADWLAGDRNEIRSLEGYAETLLLQLNPLDSDPGAPEEFLRLRGREDADGFLLDADARGLAGLRANPLSLGLLSDAVKDDGWPATRREVFEMACRNLAVERNDEHLDADGGNIVAGEEIVAAAARLSALLLLSGKDGVADRRSVSSVDWPALDDLVADQAAKRALASKLFAVRRPGCFMPVHNRVTEFLAASHLSKRIEDGLPATRVLALMKDGDGGIAASLRGLAAWLACLCSLASADLIDCDPIGVLFYGDANDLSADSKLHLLRRLGERSEEWRDVWWYSDLAVAALVSPETFDVLIDCLNGKDRSHGTQVVVEVLLEGVATNCALPRAMSPGVSPDMAKRVIAAARDATWPDSVRFAALRAAGHLAEDEMLRQLLDDMVEGRVSDEGWDLRGALLGHLYPRRIPPNKIWNYLDGFQSFKDASDEDLARGSGARMAFARGGYYTTFWRDKLLSQSDSDDIPVLMDVLSRDPSKSTGSWPNALAALPWRLLARAVELRGELMSASDLLRWIKFVAYDSRTGWRHDQHERSERASDGFCRSVITNASELGFSTYGVAPSNANRPIRTVKLWFAAHPDAQRAIYLEFLRKYSTGSILEKREFSMLIFGRAFPADFPNWCLERALEMHTTHPKSACELVEWAVQPHRLRGLPPTWLPTMEKAAGSSAALVDHLHRIARDDNEQEARRKEANPIVEHKADRGRFADLTNWARGHENALRRGQAPLPLLHSLAKVYLAHLKAKSPEDSDDRLLAGASDRGLKTNAEHEVAEHEVLEWARIGLRGILERRDLPGVDDLIEECENGWERYIARPILASIAMTITDHDAFGNLDPSLMRTAVACHLLYEPPWSPWEPWWFRRSLESRPDDVADVFVKVHRSFVRSGWPGKPVPPAALYDASAGVAKLALPRLLNVFPTRCDLSQVAMLRRMLVAASRHVPDEVAKRVRNRIEAKGMDSAQRATWLAAGVLLAPGDFTSPAIEFVEAGRGNARARHLVEFLATARNRDDLPWSGRTADDVAHATTLLRALARRFRPVYAEESIEVEVIRRLMRVLAQSPTPEAGEALGSLLDDDAVEAWHNDVERARDEQVVLRRKAEYRVPSVVQVRDVLRDETPANVADLAALVEDRMRILGRNIRDGATCDWKQYWNVDQHKQPKRPRPEEACRDAFASDLQLRLPEDVVVQIESASSDGTRADISCRYGDHAVPVEVKWNGSRDLWSAIDKQLVAKYTRIPESGGHGIYLVFWFGDEDTTTPPGNTRKPRTAEELESLLKQNLAPAQSGRIGVVVVDVGDPRPPAQATSATT